MSPRDIWRAWYRTLRIARREGQNAFEDATLYGTGVIMVSANDDPHRVSIKEFFKPGEERMRPKLGADLVAIVKRVDELSQAFDLQTDKGRFALATEIRILGVAARALLTRSTDRRQ